MKFSTANSQNRHLAYAEARFLPRNLFHFYKKTLIPSATHLFLRNSLCRCSTRPPYDRIPSATHPFPPISLCRCLISLHSHRIPSATHSFPRNSLYRCSARPPYDRISSATHPFLPISLCRALAPSRLRLPLPPNPLSLSDFLNLRAPH